MRRRLPHPGGALGPYLVLSLAVAGTACAAPDGPPAPSSPTVVDSAGVTIVTSTAPLEGDTVEWYLDPVPVTRIGAVDGPEEQILYAVIDAALHENGDVVVLQVRRPLQRYDSGGQFLNTIGGVGEGPGEFSGGVEVVASGPDQVSVHASTVRKLLVYRLDGELLSELPLTDRYPMAFSYVGASADGIHLFLENRLDVVDTLASGDRLRYASVRGITAEGDSVSFGPAIPQDVLWSAELGGGNQPFSPQGFARASADEVFAANSESYAIGVYTPSGRLTRIVRRGWTPRPVTTEEQDALKAQARENLAGFTDLGFLDHLSFPEHHPAYFDMAVNEEGYLWVQTTEEADERGDFLWDLFTPAGEWMTSVRVPEGFEIRDIRGDRVVGEVRDSMGIEFVEVRALRRRAVGR